MNFLRDSIFVGYGGKPRRMENSMTHYSGPLCQDTIWVKVKIASVLSFEMNWLLVSSRCK